MNAKFDTQFSNRISVSHTITLCNANTYANMNAKFDVVQNE